MTSPNDIQRTERRERVLFPTCNPFPGSYVYVGLPATGRKYQGLEHKILVITCFVPGCTPSPFLPRLHWSMLCVELGLLPYHQASRSLFWTPASHQCGPGSILGPDVMCESSLLLVLVISLRVFLRVLRFFSLHKNQHF